MPKPNVFDLQREFLETMLRLFHQGLESLKVLQNETERFFGTVAERSTTGQEAAARLLREWMTTASHLQAELQRLIAEHASLAVSLWEPARWPRVVRSDRSGPGRESEAAPMESEPVSAQSGNTGRQPTAGDGRTGTRAKERRREAPADGATSTQARPEAAAASPSPSTSGAGGTTSGQRARRPASAGGRRRRSKAGDDAQKGRQQSAPSRSRTKASKGGKTKEKGSK